MAIQLGSLNPNQRQRIGVVHCRVGQGFVAITAGLWVFGRVERYAKRVGKLHRNGQNQDFGD